jgi:hypothetical protein
LRKPVAAGSDGESSFFGVLVIGGVDSCHRHKKSKARSVSLDHKKFYADKFNTLSSHFEAVHAARVATVLVCELGRINWSSDLHLCRNC